MIKGEIAGVLMIRDEFAKILRQELGIDEEYQDWSYRATDRILAMPVADDMTLEKLIETYLLNKQILDGKERKV